MYTNYHSNSVYIIMRSVVRYSVELRSENVMRVAWMPRLL